MRKQIENWDNEGDRYDRGREAGKLMDTREGWLKRPSTRINLPRFEHREPPDDDTGPPEHPIYSNYVKYLWKPHRRSGGVEIGGPFPRRSLSKN